MDLEAIINVYQNAHRRDVDVVRLHSGDPSLYGAIREQMNELDRLRIAYEVVPGVSSFQAAAAALKTELTAPEVSQTVILTRTKGRTPMPPREDLARLAASQSTLCIFLSVARMDEVVAALEPHYGRDCPVGVVYRASWPEEHIVRGTLGDIVPKVHQAGFTKSAMIVVGEALGRDIPASRLYDASFAHEYRNSDE
jgi:precorrin-4/cobalt-precorrin-4 C11-methyltransferase